MGGPQGGPVAPSGEGGENHKVCDEKPRVACRDYEVVYGSKNKKKTPQISFFFWLEVSTDHYELIRPVLIIMPLHTQTRGNILNSHE